MALTALQVKNARPGRHADGKGLYLLVKPSGARSWVLRVVVNGRRRDFGLGAADLVSLSDARDKAIAGRKLAKAGKNPALEWKQHANEVPTFEKAALQYHEAVKAGWANGKHQDQWLSTLKVHVFPAIGAKSVDQIDAPDVQRVLTPIWLTIPETARRVRQRVAAVLDYSHGKGWRAGEYPRKSVDHLMRGLRQPKRGGHHAAMPYADVPQFMENLRKLPETLGRMALEFTILTAVRSGETRGSTWAEIDNGAKEWRIPATRMLKGREAHTVPLSEPAVKILGRVAGLVEGKPDELIFKGAKGKALSDMTLAKALASAGGGGFTVHGFRSAFKDWVRETCPTIPDDVSEAALSHRISNKVKAAYQRTKFLEQRRSLMTAWADFLDGSSNVI